MRNTKKNVEEKGENYKTPSTVSVLESFSFIIHCKLINLKTRSNYKHILSIIQNTFLNNH